MSSYAPGSCRNPSIEAAEQLLQTGVPAPFDIVPPLPAFLSAAIGGITGFSTSLCFSIVLLAAIVAQAAAFYSLARPRGPLRGGFMALVGLFGPSRVYLAVLCLDAPDRIVFWALIATATSLRKRSAVVAALCAGAAVLSRSQDFNSFDVVALAELALLLGLAADSARLRLLGFVGLALCLTPFGAPRETRAGLRADFRPDLRTASNPILRQAHYLTISKLHPEASLLWLKAGAQKVAYGPCAKFGHALEIKYDSMLGGCSFDVPGIAGDAVLTSRRVFDQLQPIRGLLDIEGLERYIRWSNRPEAVSVQREGNEIELRTSLGPDDLILVRENWSPNWSITPDSAKLRRDPLGFIVIDPERAGDFHAALSNARFAPTIRSRIDETRLTLAKFPAIAPGSAIDAQTFERGPFRPEQYISVFGRGFNPDSTRLLLGESRLEPMWVGESQINFQLPADASGMLELRALTGRHTSFPEAIEVRP